MPLGLDHKLPEVSYSLSLWWKDRGFIIETDSEAPGVPLGKRESIPKWNGHYWVSHKNTPGHSGQPIRNPIHLPIFPVTPLCYHHPKNRAVGSFFFLTKRKNKMHLVIKSNPFRDGNLECGGKLNACRLKPQLFPPLPVSVIPETAALEGWLRSCLQNQLAKEVWASEECHSSKERFGKHFYFCVSYKKTDLHSTPLKCHVT